MTHDESRNPMDLSGRSILVTGASSGIGRETALLLAELGARVVLNGRDEERLAQTKESLVGGEHHIAAMDLIDLESIGRMLSGIVESVGPLAGLVHSAGIQITRPIKMLDLEEAQRTMDVNAMAALALAQAFRDKRRREPQASIVFVSSVAGSAGAAANVAYSASKGALDAMTRSLAAELAREGVRVNAVVPGLVRTKLIETMDQNLTEAQHETFVRRHLLGMGEPRDVAHAIAFLLADTARWITGSLLRVDGGFLAH